MSEDKSGQFVYSRVDRSESPTDTEGFQTVMRSPGLCSEDLIEEIETLFSFDSSSGEKTKLIYSPVGNEQLVLAQLTRIDKLDSVGRGGNFLAHALIFPQPVFLEGGANPLTIARHFSFYRSLADAYQHVERKAAQLPSVSITVPESAEAPVDILHSWTTENLKNLLLLAANAELLFESGHKVVVLANSGVVCELLEAVFETLPLDLRCRLSFDSQATRYWRQSPYWALGCPVIPKRIQLLLVDPKLRSAEAIDTKENPNNSYANWLQNRVSTAGVEQVTLAHEHSWEACRLIDHGESSQTFAVDQHVASGVWDANSLAARQRLLQSLTTQLGPLLAERAMPWFISTQPPTVRFAAMHRIDTVSCREALLSAYRSLYQPPPLEEQRELDRFIQQTADHQLQLWLAAWHPNPHHLRDALSISTAEQYHAAVSDLLRYFAHDLRRLYVCGRGALFVEAVLNGLPPENVDMLLLVQLLVDARELSPLLALVPFFRFQSTFRLHKIRRLVLKSKANPPPGFLEQLEYVLDTAPPWWVLWNR